MTRAIILFSHGSSDPEWAAPFVALRDRLQQRDPATPVELAFLPPAAPTFDHVVAVLAKKHVGEIVVVPLFLARGSHVKVDLPKLIAEASALHAITFKQLPVIGDVAVLQDAIADWAMANVLSG